MSNETEGQIFPNPARETAVCTAAVVKKESKIPSNLLWTSRGLIQCQMMLDWNSHWWHTPLHARLPIPSILCQHRPRHRQWDLSAQGEEGLYVLPRQHSPQTCSKPCTVTTPETCNWEHQQVEEATRQRNQMVQEMSTLPAPWPWNQSLFLFGFSWVWESSARTIPAILNASCSHDSLWSRKFEILPTLTNLLFPPPHSKLTSSPILSFTSLLPSYTGHPTHPPACLKSEQVKSVSCFPYLRLVSALSFMLINLNSYSEICNI